MHKSIYFATIHLVYSPSIAMALETNERTQESTDQTGFTWFHLQPLHLIINLLSSYSPEPGYFLHLMITRLVSLCKQEQD